ncbi:MAG: MetQ/NlpA family ABC transporter substrate-binding protein [Clostridium sp.]|uniref:ABC transporter substrate-binding protein n=1 Tax=Clostridium sp. TaxID=1506 RepID=UPI002A90DD3D|nr:MetQ/NlpA family ABC transporter substrate-binding protein [Clostridium sp.]MDY6228276.1 MetQ/NlpA family ABC transporter substrate-binding protein [Clostridium sp.]
MKFKKLLTTFMALAMVGTMAGCTKTQTEEVKETKKLSFGAMGSIDIVPIVIAKEKGYFEEEGLELDFQLFTAAKDRDAALQAGELDGVIADEIAISIYQNSGIDMKITGATNGAWTLVVGKDSGIENLEDLKGKKMAISENTMIDYLSDYIAEENGVNSSEIEKIAIPAMPARLEALRNKQVDAAILPAPFNDTAVADGGKGLADIDNADIMISAIGFLQDQIDNNEEAIKAFFTGYNKAVEYMKNTDLKEYEDIVIKTVGYSEDTKGNIILPELNTNYLPDAEKVQAVFNWSKNNGIISKDLKAEDVIINKFIK